MMRKFAMSVLALAAVLLCSASSVSTNAVPGIVSAVAMTNAPAAKSSFAKVADDKPLRQQCEAVTKSGNRCKRNAAPGEKLCRQHLRAAARKDCGLDGAR